MWPNYLRRLRGLPADVSYVDGLWSGDFLRQDASRSDWPELFLYSKKDFYLPWQHMEEILKEREEAGRDFTAKVSCSTHKNIIAFFLHPYPLLLCCCFFFFVICFFVAGCCVEKTIFRAQSSLYQRKYSSSFSFLCVGAALIFSTF